MIEPTPAATRASWPVRLLALAIVAACVAPVVRLYLVDWPGDQWQVDLEVYREAGISVATGRPVYDWLTPVPQLLPFTYPPFAALLAVPLGWLPFTVAGWVWTAVQVLATGAIVRYAGAPLFASLARWRPGPGWTRGASLAVLAWGVLTGPMFWLHPVGDGIRFGQVNAVLVLAVLLDLRPERGRLLARVPRGVLVGLATAIKLTPGIFVVHLLLERRWRDAAWAVGTAVGVTLATWVVLPSASVAFWFDALLDPTRLGFNGGTANQSLRGWLLRSGPSGTAGTALWVVLVGVVVAVGMWAAQRYAARGLWVAQAATVGVVGVLVSPVSWIHHYHWVVVAALAVLGTVPVRPRWRAGAALLVLAWFWCRMPWWGVTWLLTTDRSRVVGRLLQNGDVLGGVLVLAVLVVLSRDRRRSPRVSRAAAARPSPRP